MYTRILLFSLFAAIVVTVARLVEDAVKSGEGKPPITKQVIRYIQEVRSGAHKTAQIIKNKRNTGYPK